jgi:hypothetical protein
MAWCEMVFKFKKLMGAQEVTQRGSVIFDFKPAVKPAVKRAIKPAVIPAKAGIHARMFRCCWKQTVVCPLRWIRRLRGNDGGGQG